MNDQLSYIEAWASRSINVPTRIRDESLLSPDTIILFLYSLQVYSYGHNLT